MRRKKIATVKTYCLLCLSIVLFTYLPSANRYQFSNFSTAYIISANTSTERYRNTQLLLSTLGLNTHFVAGVSPDSNEVKNFEEFKTNPSLYGKYKMPWALVLGHAKALRTFVHLSEKGDEWALIVEDDIAFHRNFPPTSNKLRKMIDETAQLSRRVGFFYLGLCRPTCSSGSLCMNNIQIQRCWGFCTHAYAISRTTANTFFKAVMQKREHMKEPMHFRYHIDQLYNNYFQEAKEEQRPYLLGTNMVLRGTDWHGLMYQDRWRYGSIINKDIYANMVTKRAESIWVRPCVPQ